MSKLRELRFDLVAFQNAFHPWCAEKQRTTLEVRNFKKDFFIGDAFGAAFPLAGFSLPQRWKLYGVAVIDDEEYSFDWEPNGLVTFDGLISSSAEHWAQLMENVAEGRDALSIKCVAWIV